MTAPLHLADRTRLDRIQALALNGRGLAAQKAILRTMTMDNEPREDYRQRTTSTKGADHMEASATLQTIGKTSGRLTLAALKWIYLYPVVWAWATLRWAGRVSLWILFLPLGIFTSYRHGKKKDQRKLIDAIEKARR